VPYENFIINLHKNYFNQLVTMVCRHKLM
jgi:hypothetical protein